MLTFCRTGFSAYGVHILSIQLSDYVARTSYTHATAILGSSAPELVRNSTALLIHWSGIIVSLFLVGLATFWLAQAILAVAFRFPRSFNLGFWALIFPNGVYANALCRLGTDLQNDGLKIWAAVWVIAVALLWLGCALMTGWKATWRAEMSSIPGLVSYVEGKLVNKELHRDDLR